MPCFAERLRALLPDLYLLEDTTNDLSAFLQVIGGTGDELQQAIEHLPTVASADTCPPDFLPLLSALVGYAYDALADPDRQRLGLVETLERYRRQGTRSALCRELIAHGWQGEIVETHQRVMRLNRRSRLNRQRLPGPHYNLGVFLVDGLTFVEGVAEIVTRHQPAGTRGWIRQGHALLSTGAYTPAGVSALTVEIRMQSFHRRRFGLNLSALNTGAPLTESIRDIGAVTVL